MLSGWAVSWSGSELGFAGIPTVLLGVLVWATVTGQYRRRRPPQPGDGYGPRSAW